MIELYATTLIEDGAQSVALKSEVVGYITDAALAMQIVSLLNDRSVLTAYSAANSKAVVVYEGVATPSAPSNAEVEPSAQPPGPAPGGDAAQASAASAVTEASA